MPLSFASPALLLGAAAAILPVVIHLLSRRRVKRQHFSDLRFLHQVQGQQSRSLGLRRWLLLLLRVLAILALALAVAGPHWGGLGSGGSDRAVLFLLDASASMGTQQTDRTRFETAQADCREMILAMPPETLVQVIVAADQATPLFADWLPAGAGAGQGIQAARLTEGGFNLPAALEEVSRQVATAPPSQVEVLLLSDLQELPAGEALTAAATRLAAGGRVQFLVRGIGTEQTGGGILSLRLPERAIRPREKIDLTATVLPEYEDQTFLLELDGAVVAEIAAPGPAGQIQEVVFPLTAPGSGLHLGRIRKDRDSLPADDEHPFILVVPPTVQVLLLHGEDRPVDGPAGRGGWRFLAEALSPGGTDPLFAVSVVTAPELTTEVIVGSDVVYWVDPDPLGRENQQALLAWLRQGGRVALLCGEVTRADYLAGVLLPALGLPPQAEFRATGSSGVEHGRILARTHPVFAGLRDEALGSLEDVSWRRYFHLDEGPARVLMHTTSESPLLIEGTFGQGQYVILPFHLLPAATDLAASSMALPFFQRLTAWLANQADSGVGRNILVGEVPLVIPDAAGAASLALSAAEDLLAVYERTATAMVPALTWQGNRPRLAAEVVLESGFITFAAAEETVGVVAAAVPATETSLQLAESRVWSRSLAAAGLAPALDLTGKAATLLPENLAGRDLAPWFFGLSILLLLIELTLGRGTSLKSDGGPRGTG